MPRLLADGYGNLTVIWAAKSDTPGLYRFYYQRFDASAAAWLGPKPITDATTQNAKLPQGAGSHAAAGNRSGRAALSFADLTSTRPSNLRLASFD